MKQEVVVKVQMNCAKCRSKALQIAAAVSGVREVRIEGEEKDQVVVIGEGVDLVGLTRSLRRKVGYATIVSVVVIKEDAAAAAAADQVQELDHSNLALITVCSNPLYPPRPNPCPQFYLMSEPINDDNKCSIL